MTDTLRGLTRLVLFAAWALNGASCGKKVKDCAKVSDATKRDWCYFDTMITYAQAKRTEDAVHLVQYIEAPSVRAAAIDRLFGANPPGLDVQQAAKLCGTLPSELSDGCLNKWNRPHLWVEPRR